MGFPPTLYDVEERQGETRREKSKEGKHQPILSDSTYSNTSRRQLHVSRAREERVLADLLVAARCTEAEAEVTASKLRTELATAIDRARTTQKQIQNQTKLASRKDHVIQSITEESQVVETKLKGTEDKIAHLGVELRHERVLWLRERDKRLDRQTRMRDCFEAEIRRIAQEALSAQEKLYEWIA